MALTIESYNTYYQYRSYGENLMSPVGPLALISAQLDSVLADQINDHLRNRRSQYMRSHPELDKQNGFIRTDYRIPVDLKRFTSGEGRARVAQSVRGHDIYIISDVLNYGQYYTRFNQTVSKSPDDHYQDLIRLVMATRGSAERVNVIMPYLYGGRQYRRTGRESMDCAQILKQLFDLGIDNFITFDAHDSRVANAVPASNFESFQTSFQIIESFVSTVDHLILDPDHFMIISPDEMGISRCIYYASLMKVPLGIFYRRRDYRHVGTQVFEEITKRYLGDDVTGKDVLIVDDMIDTGNTMLECAHVLKQNGARRVFCAVSYAQFTQGLSAVNQAYEQGVISRIFATNLAYRAPALRDAPWYTDVDLSKYVALLIDALNHDASISDLISPTERITNLLNRHRYPAQLTFLQSEETPE